MVPRISTAALWRSLRRVLALLGAVALLAAVTAVAIIVQAGRTTAPPDAATTALVMLDPPATVAARLDRARQLYLQGKLARILLAGGDTAAGRATLQARGIRDDAILAVDEATSQAQFAAINALLERERPTNTLLIAEPVQTLRLLKIAHDTGLRPYSTPLGDDQIAFAATLNEVIRYYEYVVLDQ